MGTVRITRQGKFLDGVAYPSLHYGFDFGDGPRGTNLGLHHKARIDKVNADFAELASNGIHSVRMNVFADGRTGIDFNHRSRQIQVQDSVLVGLGKVLDAAKANNIHLSLVMLDHKFAEGQLPIVDANNQEVGKKQGHGVVLKSPLLRKQLLDNVFRKVLERIGNDPNLLSVELINEPESLIDGMSTNDEIKNADSLIPQAELGDFKAYLREFRDLVHNTTGAQFTVGSLALKFAGEWLDVLDPQRDYLSIHYYGENDEPPYSDIYRRTLLDRLTGRQTLKELQSRIPVVWGEYPAQGAREFQSPKVQPFDTTLQFLDDALRNGIKGGYGWSFYSAKGERGGESFGPIPWKAHQEFTARNALRIEFGGGSAPALPRRLFQRLDFTPGTVPRDPSKRINRITPNPWNPFSPTNPLSPLNPMNPANPLNIARRAQDSRALNDRMMRAAESARELTKRSLAAIPPPRPITPSPWKSPGQGFGVPSSISRPPFGPLGGRSSQPYGGGPIVPYNYQPPHIPTWRDYHTPRTIGNPFAPRVQDWGRLPMQYTPPPPPRRDFGSGSRPPPFRPLYIEPRG
jgi:hypothetical protein